MICTCASCANVSWQPRLAYATLLDRAYSYRIPQALGAMSNWWNSRTPGRHSQMGAGSLLLGMCRLAVAQARPRAATKEVRFQSLLFTLTPLSCASGASRPHGTMTQQDGDTGHQMSQNVTPAYSTLPEVVAGFRDSGTLPEVRVPPTDKIMIGSNLESKRDSTSVIPAPYAPDAVSAAERADSPEVVTTQGKPWYQRGRNPILLAVAAIVIILAVVGISLGVVLSKNNSPSSGGASSTPTTSSAPGTASPAFGTPISFPVPAAGETPLSTCQGTVCPQLLATAQYATPATTFLFARGSDSAIWVRTISGGVWGSKWTSLGGTFISQPAAASMRDGRVDVFAISSEDQSARFKTFQNGVWEKEWTSLGGRSSSGITVCSKARDNLHIITMDAENGVYHKYMDDGINWLPALVNKWEKQGGYASSTVDIGCVNEGGVQRVDLVAYGRGNPDFGMTLKRWNSTGWSGWLNATGSFRGDPTVLSTREKAEYFGVAVDGAVWTRSWASAAGTYSEGENLGGKFQSAVSVFATGDSRVDVVGVGTDAQLWHKARISGTWGTEWESLGGYFNSAPRAVVLDSKAGQVVIFGLGPNGTIIHTNVTAGIGYAWGALQWYSDEGSMTAKWYRLGPA